MEDDLILEYRGGRFEVSRSPNNSSLHRTPYSQGSGLPLVICVPQFLALIPE